MIEEIAKSIGPENHALQVHYSEWAQRLCNSAWTQLRDCLLKPFVPIKPDHCELPFLPRLKTLKVGAEAKVVLPARIVLAGMIVFLHSPIVLKVGGVILLHFAWRKEETL